MSSGKHQQKFWVGDESLGGRIIVKAKWTERLEFNIDIYCTSWVGGGAKVVWQWVIVNSLCGEANSIVRVFL